MILEVADDKESLDYNHYHGINSQELLLQNELINSYKNKREKKQCQKYTKAFL